MRICFRLLRRSWVLSFVLLASGGLAQAAEGPLWPDAPPAQLKEELFGIRLRMKLDTGGAKGATKFLKAELARDPLPHTKAFVAWVSLFSDEWKIPALVDPVAARRLAEEAAAGGSLVGADVLGRVLIEGRGGERDVPAGLQRVESAARAGCPQAMGRWGVYLLEGFGGRQVRLDEGDKWVRRAAAHGAPAGLAEAADGFAAGRMGGTSGPAFALQYAVLLAQNKFSEGAGRLRELAKKGVPGADFYLLYAVVQFANDGGDIIPSLGREMVAALETKRITDGRGWVELGIAHLEGFYAKRDYPLALSCFQRAAGLSDAKFFLAYAKLRGWGVPREPHAALAEMEALADAGNARAAGKLGWLYYWGASEVPGMPKDEAKAFTYLRQAAAGGHWVALMNLGYCYDHGIGVKENPVLASKVYFEALDYGVLGAKERLQRNLAFAKIP
ncbi:MAG: sel1 repeat family protein [Opitutae bacterium]|nr:sel1 repeat family protein [Opitutae bacterium]